MPPLWKLPRDREKDKCAAALCLSCGYSLIYLYHIYIAFAPRRSSRDQQKSSMEDGKKTNIVIDQEEQLNCFFFVFVAGNAGELKARLCLERLFPAMIHVEQEHTSTPGTEKIRPNSFSPSSVYGCRSRTTISVQKKTESREWFVFMFIEYL